jgi:aspartate/methionine/tyrosine aminotransferase
VSAAAWAEEAQVEQGRALYRENFAIGEELLSGRYGCRRPAGRFFLWLNMADFAGGEGAAKTLWKACSVKVLPGAFSPAKAGTVESWEDHVRVSLVHDGNATREALALTVATLG